MIFRSLNITQTITMYKNYFLTAWRNLLRNKFYTSINISGLAIGLSVGIMILLWVQDEFSYDGFHSNAKNIYKINSHLGSGAGSQVWEGSPSPLAVHSRKEIPEVENAVRIADNYESSLFEYKEKHFPGTKMAYADPSFFTVFDFKLKKGNRLAPFEGSHSVILTSSVARKYFGEEDPIGKVLVADKKDNYKVTGVLEDFPQNSTIQYDMIFPMDLNAEKFRGNGSWKTIDEDLGNYFYKIYIQLKPGASPEVAEKKISRMFAGLKGEVVSDGSFTLQPLKDLHLYAPDGNASAMQSVRTFLMVAILILIIACINYVNLSTARSILRSKEVSVRKIIGAGRNQLFIQFICESVLLFFISSILAFAIIRLMLPLYNEISGKQLVLSLGNAEVWLVLLGSIVGSLIIASIYPAVLLSSFKPVEALKGKLSGGTGNAGFRKALVVTQFVFSVALIISTIVIGLQLKYVREKDLGYDKEHIFSFFIRQELFDHFAAARTELLKNPGVLEVSSSTSPIVGVNTTTGDTDWEGKEAGSTFLVHANGVDEHFIPLFKINMAEGKNFTGAKSDSAHVILNETAVKEAGIKNPIGKRFTLWQNSGTIIGVIKDFNYSSLKEKIEPLVFFYQPASYRMFVKTTGKDADKAIAATQKMWTSYIAAYPFGYTFVDEDYDRLYKNEQRTATLFNVFAVVAISICCLGLFGLSTYTAQVKRKEVGIRKVLGASVSNITGLLAKDFVVLVFISLLIAIPIAWWAMNAWLQDFVYRISISWWVFALSGIIAVFIAFVTVSFQAIKAAMANPVTSLKEE